jgi:hypothetical protein
MPSMAMLEIPASGMDSNIGLPPALRENYLDPRMVNHIEQIIADILTLQDYVMPSYIDTSGGDDGGGGGGCTGVLCGGGTSTPLTVEVRDSKWDFADATAGHVYHIQCQPNKTVGIPGGTVLSNVVIVADCLVSTGAGVTLTNVLLASSAVGAVGNDKPLTKVNISFAANAQLGVADNCAPGGGVQIFSAASVKFSSTTGFEGVQIVAAGDIELGARDMGINGISAQSGGNITMTSNNMFGLCSGGAPNLFTVNYYRLVL